MCDFKDEVFPCKCKTAVLQAYQGLIAHDLPESFAREAATHRWRKLASKAVRWDKCAQS